MVLGALSRDGIACGITSIGVHCVMRDHHGLTGGSKDSFRPVILFFLQRSPRFREATVAELRRPHGRDGEGPTAPVNRESRDGGDLARPGNC